MMGSLPAKRQVMRKRAPVTCPNAPSQSGENGQNVQENSVELEKLAPGPEAEIASLL